MQDYEILGQFYLGKPIDLATRKHRPGYFLYDSKDLLTHAVCVGMTGSGKTGLCVGLLEEAAIDGVPAIVIDPKGDLGNLLLSFPALQAEEFAPWVNEEEARRKGMNTAQFAAEQAERWKKGLGDWDQGPERIQKLRQAAEFAVYTPGARFGMPLSILKSFTAPSASVLADREILLSRVNTTVSSLLGLLGIEADPLQSREHILLANLIDRNWREGKDCDLASLIAQIQKPPFSNIGAFDLESFFPAKERFQLAMRLNNLLAAPGFDVWMEGEALDIDRLLYTPQGKPKISIISIAHLSDSERMFVVSFLLGAVLEWVRKQSGTSSLRAILFMDEIYGYFPPVANPPSKIPLLTLLKQARAFGLGVVLATQNPVDLDYKGLANAGTWFLGRLQTERDKQRVLEGLEGAAAQAGSVFDRQKMEQTLAALGNRIFLVANAHQDAPEIIETRWTLSYLRGPLGRDQIARLMSSRKETVTEVTSNVVSTVSNPETRKTSSMPPSLAPQISQFFVAPRSKTSPGKVLCYQPMLSASASLRFADAKKKVDCNQESNMWVAIGEDPIAVDWDLATPADISPDQLEKQARAEAEFSELASPAHVAKNYAVWSKNFQAWLLRSQKLELWKSPTQNLFSNPGESERDFRIRLTQSVREKRDQAIEALRQKYASKLQSLETRILRASQMLEKEKEQAKQQKFQTAISFGATLLGAFLGRKAVSASSLGRATTTARGVSRASKENQDVARAQENLGELQNQITEMQEQFRRESAEIEAAFNPIAENLEKLLIPVSRGSVTLRFFSLVWLPYWRDHSGVSQPAWK